MNYTLLKGLKNLNHRQPDATWTKANKQVLLSYFNNNFSSTHNHSFGFSLMLRPVVATFIILGIVLAGGVGTIYAAKNTVPGQHLYAVKIFTERVRLAMTTNLAQKNVLRAELLNSRMTEALVLAHRVNDRGDLEAGKNLVAAVHNIKSEIGVLQKGIHDQAKSATNDNADNLAAAPVATADQGALPVEDGKKAAEIILSPDVQKSLLETQELLAKKDLTNALVKTEEASAQLDLTSNTSTAPTTPANSNTNDTTSTDSNIKKPADPPAKDFTAPIIQDNSSTTDLTQNKNK